MTIQWRLALLCALCACGSTTSSLADGGAGSDGGSLTDVDGGARCTVTTDLVHCSFNRTAFTGGVTRDVYWQTPSSPAPAGGYPVVLLYQGSFFGPSNSWGDVPSSQPFGGYYQAKLQATLLAHGFTVIAPSAASGLAWQTNLTLDWNTTEDKPFIDALLAAIGRGDFGPADPTHFFATGISSGGYMTSRMALSYQGVFRALAIESASWATCGGALCVLPSTLPPMHPPTLFLHGRLDLTVPLVTAQAYESWLTTGGISTDLIIDDTAGHQWLSVAPERVTQWFETH
jgi:pimeloyl-ACP methyl ester carboxylesterase